MGRAARFLLMAYHWFTGQVSVSPPRDSLGPDLHHNHLGPD